MERDLNLLWECPEKISELTGGDEIVALNLAGCQLPTASLDIDSTPSPDSAGYAVSFQGPFELLRPFPGSRTARISAGGVQGDHINVAEQIVYKIYQLKCMLRGVVCAVN